MRWPLFIAWIVLLNVGLDLAGGHLTVFSWSGMLAITVLTLAATCFAEYWKRS